MSTVRTSVRSGGCLLQQGGACHRHIRAFASCGHCGSSPLEGPEFFWCAACGKVPPATSAQSVTYFEALGLQPRFDIDLTAVKPHLAAVQKRLEGLARAGEDMAALQAYAGRVQEAFLTLRDKQKRAEYLLRLQGSCPLGDTDVELLPEVRALEDAALSAEVEDAGALHRAVGTNEKALDELEGQLESALRAEAWPQAGRAMLELHQRKGLRRRLTDLAVENNEAATPAHSSVLGGVD